LPLPPRPSLFPYTTLFRSTSILAPNDDLVRGQIHDGGPPHMGVALVVHPQATLVCGEVTIIDDVERRRGTRGGYRDRLSNDNSTDRKSTRLNSSHVKSSYA